MPPKYNRDSNKGCVNSHTRAAFGTRDHATCRARIFVPFLLPVDWIKGGMKFGPSNCLLNESLIWQLIESDSDLTDVPRVRASCRPVPVGKCLWAESPRNDDD